MSTSTFLFDKIIFGPVQSRRLGVSLGINLLPVDCKLCNFNCIYCECGWNTLSDSTPVLPSASKIKTLLEQKLMNMAPQPDVITFAGNGEPTIHPQFEEVVNDTLALRNKYCPQAKVAVLTNATMNHKISVFNALCKVDQNIQKLDTVNEQTYRLLNKPSKSQSINEIIEGLVKFNSHLIIQTLFLKGIYQGKQIDNTTNSEVNNWLKAIKRINPREVMLYSFSRATPHQQLTKISKETLEPIAKKVRQLGINASVNV